MDSGNAIMNCDMLQKLSDLIRIPLNPISTGGRGVFSTPNLFFFCL